MSDANKYLQQLGSELEVQLGDGFKFSRSRLELRRKANDGADVIILAGSTKYSPFISVAFYFGRNFDEAKRLEKLTGDHPMPYHIQQYSPNLRSMRGLSYAGPSTWEVDITNPPEKLAQQITVAIKAMAYPFFEKFSTLQAAQIALADGDSWCFNARGPFYHMLLKVDASLKDLEHFEQWSKCLQDFYRNQSTESLMKYKKAIEIGI